MATWYTSDQHYDHRNIIEYCGRPFAGVDEMREAMIARHNARVAPADTVYHLGDFALREDTVPTVLGRLNGRHILIAGNHDRCHPCHKRHEAAGRRYLAYGFAAIHTQLVCHPPWGETMLCHLPAETFDARYPEFRPDPRWIRGGVLLHGHVHERYRDRAATIGERTIRMVNVGVDQWGFAPVAETEIAALLAS